MSSSEIQGKLWGRAPTDWMELQESFSVPLWQSMLDAVGVGAGTAFLDAGCGAGGASVLARHRGASVTGLDASDALLALARNRVPDGDFRVGDLEALPFGNGVFQGGVGRSPLSLFVRSRLAFVSRVLDGDEWFEVDALEHVACPTADEPGRVRPTSTATKLQPNAT